MTDLSKTSSAGTEWTVKGWFTTTDHDRIAIMNRDGRWAVSYSCAPSDAPQFIEYDRAAAAQDVFLASFQRAQRTERVAFQQLLNGGE